MTVQLSDCDYFINGVSLEDSYLDADEFTLSELGLSLPEVLKNTPTKDPQDLRYYKPNEDKKNPKLGSETTQKQMMLKTDEPTGFKVKNGIIYRLVEVQPSKRRLKDGSIIDIPAYTKWQPVAYVLDGEHTVNVNNDNDDFKVSEYLTPLNRFILELSQLGFKTKIIPNDKKRPNNIYKNFDTLRVFNDYFKMKIYLNTGFKNWLNKLDFSDILYNLSTLNRKCLIYKG